MIKKEGVVVAITAPVGNRADGLPPREERHYFTSLAAIYEVFTAEQVGCALAHLWNIKVSDGRVYTSRSGLCRIWRDKVVSKAHTKQGKYR